MAVKYIKDHKTQETVYPITKSECIIDAHSINNYEIDQIFDESPEYESSDSGIDYLNYNGLKHYHEKISEEIQTGLDNVQVDLTGYATESWVKEQNYLTEHQDISGKVDIADFEEATLVTSAALNTLNQNLAVKESDIQILQTQVLELQNQISIVNTTWAELKEMRDNGELIAGQQYRITDYVATTTDPESRSANHPFDIIVTADDERTLNENARAALHEGDEYFAKCNIELWKLKYSLDNDIKRFNWAQEGGEGYTLDFTSSLGMVLQGKLLASDDTTFEGLPYVFIVIIEGLEIMIYAPAATLDSITICKVDIMSQIEDLPCDAIINTILTDGYGVVYQMIDENNNEMQYDFKGIQFKRYRITTSEGSPDLVDTWASAYCSDDVVIDLEDYRWCYLFNIMFGDDSKDASVYQYDAEYTTAINGCTNKTSVILPNGVVNADIEVIMSGDIPVYSSYSWTCGNSCSGWTCGNGCNYWTCGNSCGSWICGNGCNYWTCGGSCNSWRCGNICSYWRCGDSCNSWACDSYCSYWICSNSCSDWTCGGHSNSWTCGSNCFSWRCGINCNNWTCGNYCIGWECGDGCKSWTCGNSCSYWTLQTRNSCLYFKILEGVKGTADQWLSIPFTPNTNYQQLAGMKTDGTLRVWNPADV